MSAFSIALSGLNAQTAALDVVGNNLANLNTTGFKASSAEFQNLVNDSLLANNPFSGAGVAPPGAAKIFSQGSISASAGPFDAAIQGDGFFVVQNQSGATEYTRAGNFKLDSSGNLITSSGQYVMGWTATNGTVTAGGAVTKITVPQASLGQPSATTKFSLDLNLDATAQTGQTSGTFSAPLQVVDSLGEKHTITATFTKTGTGAWSYELTLPAADTGATATTPTSLVKGTLKFDSSGNLTSPAAADAPVAVSVTGLADGAADLNMNWNFFDGTGSSTITQLAQTSALSGTPEDGTAVATLTHVGISNGGTILAQYSDGTSQVVAQLGVANILNPESLVDVGNNSFEVSSQTAPPSIGASGTAGRGDIQGGALEGSTSDIATEFTHLIQYQQGYEANSKVITTMDEIAQQVIQMIR